MDTICEQYNIKGVIYIYKTKQMNMELNKMISIPSEVIKITLISKKEDIRRSLTDSDSFWKFKCNKTSANKSVDVNSNILCRLDIKPKSKLDFYELNKSKYDVVKSEDKTDNIRCQLIVQNLEFDRRIRKYEKYDDIITVYFWNMKGSISFYQQYFLSLNMNFGKEQKMEHDSQGWRDYTLNNDFPLSFTTLPTICKEKTIKISEDKPVEQTPLKYNFNFNERILYFSELSKYFSINDLKHLQNTLEENSYDMIFENPRELAVGIASNVIFQDIIKRIDQQCLENVVDNLNYDLAPISATKYGAYAIQNLISCLKTGSAIQKVKKYFNPFIFELCRHPIGNYTVQKILKLDGNYIFKHLIDRFVDIISDDLAFKVFKNCLESFVDRHEVVKELILIKGKDIDPKKTNELIQLLKKN